MRKTFIILVAFSLLMLSCKLVEQNDFILRKSLITQNNESIFYDVYQTGLDNYTFKFFKSLKSDTSKIFEYYLNDAVYSVLHLETTIVGDTILVKSNMPSENQIHKLPSGKTFIFMHSK